MQFACGLVRAFAEASGPDEEEARRFTGFWLRAVADEHPDSIDSCVPFKDAGVEGDPEWTPLQIACCFSPRVARVVLERCGTRLSRATLQVILTCPEPLDEQDYVRVLSMCSDSTLNGQDPDEPPAVDHPITLATHMALVTGNLAALEAFLSRVRPDGSDVVVDDFIAWQMYTEVERDATARKAGEHRVLGSHTRALVFRRIYQVVEPVLEYQRRFHVVVGSALAPYIAVNDIIRLISDYSLRREMPYRNTAQWRCKHCNETLPVGAGFKTHKLLCSAAPRPVTLSPSSALSR